MAEEYLVGITDGLTENTNFDLLPDLTMSDLLDALTEIDVIGGCDILILGKRITSGKNSREVGGFTAHFEDTEEIFEYLKGEYDPDDVEDSLEIIEQIFGLGEPPEKVIGFVIKVLE